MNSKRIERLNNIDIKKGNVVYWMSRDQRVDDNWSFVYAVETARKMKQPVGVVFTLTDSFLKATYRQYSFMLSGLSHVEKRLEKINIPFFILYGDPPEEILKFINKNKTGILITDFSPLKINREWKKKVSDKIKTAFVEVDGHNIIPCRLTSDKQEFSARTIRPKIYRLLPEFLTEFPGVKRHSFSWQDKTTGNDFKRLDKRLKIDRNVENLRWIIPGEKEALNLLRHFIEEKLDSYASDRNNPLKDGQSELSPYIHFGQISAQRIALEIQKAGADLRATESFLEELIIRRELAENFCFYNRHYDSFQGFPEWAKRTLEKHSKDRRDYVYSLSRFESAETHDDLWNAAQRQMFVRGKMGGYMRMYWAKKILEWSKTPEEAFETAIYLNDRYELDGRDPNGYTGVAWSIGGLHDRPWFSRPVFGSVRYMSRNGMKNKFNVEEYINRF